MPASMTFGIGTLAQGISRRVFMLKTEALYYSDRYMKECQARLLSVDIVGGKIYMVFDRTLFFPGGGGQAQDRGYVIDDSGIKFDICGINEKEGLTYHEVRMAKDGLESLITSRQGILDSIDQAEKVSMIEDYIGAKLKADPIFRMVLDWEHREDYMHQHSGQHVLSGVFYKLFSRNTLGLHIGKDLSQLDIEGEFDHDMVKEVERYANLIVSQEIKIDNFVLDRDKLEDTYTRRPLPNTSEDIRILKIGDLDINACCGVHSTDTGQLKLIKIKKYYHHKGNTRFEYLVGKRAISYILDRDEYFSKLLLKYDTNEANILNAIGNLEDKKDDFAEKNKLLLDFYLEARSKSLLEGLRENSQGIIVVRGVLDDDAWMVEALAKYITNNYKSLVIFASGGQAQPRVFLQVDKKLAKEESIKLGKVLKDHAGLADIRGGGSDYMAQGQVLDKKNIDKFIDKIYSIYTSL